MYISFEERITSSAPSQVAPGSWGLFVSMPLGSSSRVRTLGCMEDSKFRDIAVMLASDKEVVKSQFECLVKTGASQILMADKKEIIDIVALPVARAICSCSFRVYVDKIKA